jgi:hypothetical protein
MYLQHTFIRKELYETLSLFDIELVFEMYKQINFA